MQRSTLSQRRPVYTVKEAMLLLSYLCARRRGQHVQAWAATVQPLPLVGRKVVWQGCVMLREALQLNKPPLIRALLRREAHAHLAGLPVLRHCTLTLG